MTSPHEIQYYIQELKRLEHPWIQKIRKILELDRVEIVSDKKALCKPIEGYNRNPKAKVMEFNGWNWTCNCQGYQKRSTCSHVEALKLKIKFKGASV